MQEIKDFHNYIRTKYMKDSPRSINESYNYNDEHDVNTVDLEQIQEGLGLTMKSGWHVHGYRKHRKIAEDPNSTPKQVYKAKMKMASHKAALQHLLNTDEPIAEKAKAEEKKKADAEKAAKEKAEKEKEL